jgi:hypothetical protein
MGFGVMVGLVVRCFLIHCSVARLPSMGAGDMCCSKLWLVPGVYSHSVSTRIRGEARVSAASASDAPNVSRTRYCFRHQR